MKKISITLIVIAILIISCFLGGCKNDNTSSMQKMDINKNDLPFLNFGKIFAVEFKENINFNNPHEVAIYAVNQCMNENIDKLLNEMPQVDEDKELNYAFQEYIKMSGDDLKQFNDKSIFLKFYGYSLNKSVSLWYYYITDHKGSNLQHSPWVSLHRSIVNQRCALTGIFLYDEEIGGPGEMPSHIITSLEE